jgi:hypothetical protein
MPRRLRHRGWALYLQGDCAGAERARRSGAAVPQRRRTNQLHLAELVGQEERSRDRARALPDRAWLAGITPQQRDQAKARSPSAGEVGRESRGIRQVADRHARSQARGAAHGARQQYGRQELPALVLKDLQGNNVDLRAERGNVVLLNFFSAW